MSSISFSTHSSIYDYGRFANGRKIQRASDGAAELSILQKQEEQMRGYRAGSSNIRAAQSLANISDGAQAGITDHLQRINELAVQASNSLLSQSDRAAIQQEIDIMKEGISQIASTTNYNGKNLLDGSNSSLGIASESGQIPLSTSNASLEALGIADFNVMGDFDLKQISDALASVSAGRSKMGAQSNGLEHAYRSLTNTALNTAASQSRIGDLDYPKAVTEQKKKEVLQQYSYFMQKSQMRIEAGKMVFFE